MKCPAVSVFTDTPTALYTHRYHAPPARPGLLLQTQALHHFVAETLGPAGPSQEQKQDPWRRVLFSNTVARGQNYLNNNPIISFLGAFPIPKLFPPKNIIEQRLGINVILLCFKCENRSVILCLVSKPSIGVELGKKNKTPWVAWRSTRKVK